MHECLNYKAVGNEHIHVFRTVYKVNPDDSQDRLIVSHDEV